MICCPTKTTVFLLKYVGLNIQWDPSFFSSTPSFSTTYCSSWREPYLARQSRKSKRPFHPLSVQEKKTFPPTLFGRRFRLQLFPESVGGGGRGVSWHFIYYRRKGGKRRERVIPQQTIARYMKWLRDLESIAEICPILLVFGFSTSFHGRLSRLHNATFYYTQRERSSPLPYLAFHISSVSLLPRTFT